jgi:Rhodopirellula transposase DDE domain
VTLSAQRTSVRSRLKVCARLDQRDYPQKIQVTDQEIAAVNLARDPFHPEWNYTISPTPEPAA